MSELTTKDYQKFAGYTDMIKPEKQRYYYPLGQGGEGAEMLEKIYNLKPNSSKDEIREAVKEVGDCAWYCVRWMNALDSTYLPNDICVDGLCEENVSYHQALHFCILAVVKIGKCLDIQKKVIRDNDDRMTEDSKKIILSHLNDILVLLAYCSKALGYDFSETCELNLAKLNSRKMRDTIGGSGDNR